MSRLRLKNLTNRFNFSNHQQQDLPPGFDARIYRELNPDVAQAYPDGVGAAAHYLAHGSQELRRIMPDGIGIQDRQHRMLHSDHDRSDWVAWLRRQGNLNAVLARHPRAAWLNTPFNLASYLLARPDVAILLDTALQGAFHFLEFGVEEGYYGCPAQIEPAYLRKAYPGSFADASDSQLSDIHAVVQILRAAGHKATEISLTEAEFWELQGLPGQALSKLFDHEYYHADATRQGMPPESLERLSCIKHLGAKGIAAGLTLHPDLQFDPSFYLEHWIQIVDDDTQATQAHLSRDARYEKQLGVLATALAIDVQALSQGISGTRGGAGNGVDIHLRLYRHWLHVGLRKGVAPNIQHWCKTHFEITMPDSLAQRLRELAKAAHEEYGSVLDRMTRLLREPMRYLDHMPELAADEAFALSILADKMTVEGRVDQAEWLYRTILTQYPDQEITINHLADLMTRMGRAGAEYQLRMLSYALPEKKRGGGVWNLLGLAELALNQDQLRMAITYIAAAAEGIAGDHAQHIKYRALVSRLLWDIWGQIGIFARDYGIEAAQNFLRTVLRLATPDQGPVVQPRQPIRHVALVANMDLYQCKLYRVDQKLEQLREAGFDVSVFNQWHDMASFQTQLGSRLIDIQSQNMTVAASATAERKTFGHLS